MRSIDETLEILKAKGLAPDVVLDVGVATGTPWLYKAFPDAFYHLFEPIPDFRPQIENHLTRLRGRLHDCALGDRDGEAVISVGSGARKGGASIVFQGPHDGFRETIRLRRLTTVLGVADLGETNVLKTDCQGADLAVLQGAGDLLDRFDVVISESPMKSKLFTFSDMVVFMRERGFEVVDIVDPLLRPSDGMLGQVDIVFVRRDGELFRGPGW